MRKRLEPAERFEALIGVALELASEIHYLNLSPTKIARRAGCSPSLVSHYLGAAACLRATVLREAIRRGSDTVQDQARALGHVQGSRLRGDVAALEYRCVE